jgi:hypothetical protein
MLTMIAPVCKQAMRVGKKNSQYEWRHVLYAPDKSVFYSGGYEGDITVISNRQFARQHMLPGVINAGADTGKGCGPAAYMAGPFVAVRRAPSAAGVYSIPGGRSGAAEAAWENALRHRTASNLPRGTERTVNVPVQDLVSFAKDNNMPRISNEGFQLITDVEPQIEVQIRGANSVYNVIYTLTILKLGIIVHMTPDQESAVIRSLPPNSVSSPFVPPPGIWRQLDLANFGSDDNFLLECLDYCARKFEEFGGGISSQDYLRTALTGLRDNPSLLPPVEWVDRQLAQIGGRTARLAANPSVRSAAVQAAEQRVSAFLNDPTWVSYGGVENPRR